MNTWAKDIVRWCCGKTLYISVPFTWLLAEAEAMAAIHKGPVIAGGPAVNLVGAPWADEAPGSCPFDVLAMHNPCATFTTRGCPNSCEFCAVPKLEGDFRELATWKPAPVICDNNLTEASQAHFARVIETSLQFPHVDFNQGLDARKFTRWHADQIARLASAKVRFAFDHVNAESSVRAAIDTAREAGLRDFGVYVLIGFHDTPEDARYRLDTVMSWKVWPNPMRFQPLNATEKNSYVEASWTESELRRMMKYYSRQRWLKGVPYDQYRPPAETLFAEATE